MLNKMNNQWSGKALYNKVQNGTVNFDSYVQRHYVWDGVKNSLLIHSILTGYPIPPFYMAKDGDTYIALDGKQRSNAIVSFMNDGYLLSLDEDYREVDGSLIDGKKFSELPEELQDRIKDVSLTIYFFDGISDDEIEEMFFRLNNGKPLSTIELTRVRARSKDIIGKLAAHDLFGVAMTEKAIKKYENEKIVMNTYVLLSTGTTSLLDKDVRAIVEKNDMTEDDVAKIKDAFDKILSAYNSVVKTAPKIAKRMLRKTHLISLMKLASRVSLSELVSFILGFYNGKNRAASVSNSYNSNCNAGSAKPESVARRLAAMDDFFRGNDAEANIAQIKAQALATAAQKPEPTSEPEVEAELEADSDVDPDYDTSFPTLADIEQSLYGTSDEETAKEAEV